MPATLFVSPDPTWSSRSTVKVQIRPPKLSDTFPKVHKTDTNTADQMTAWPNENFQTRHCTLTHSDSSLWEQKSTFCVLHGDSPTFSASSSCFCHFRSASFSLSLYFCPHSLESILCPSKVRLFFLFHTSPPSSWPEEFLVTEPLRLTPVCPDAPGDPGIDGYTLKAPTVHNTK